MGVVLRSREYLVDALSFHSAEVRHPVKIRALIGSRKACLHKAIAWEDLAGYSLLDYDYDGNDVGSTFWSRSDSSAVDGSAVEGDDSVQKDGIDGDGDVGRLVALKPHVRVLMTACT